MHAVAFFHCHGVFDLPYYSKMMSRSRFSHKYHISVCKIEPRIFLPHLEVLIRHCNGTPISSLQESASGPQHSLSAVPAILRATGGKRISVHYKIKLQILTLYRQQARLKLYVITFGMNVHSTYDLVVLWTE